MAGFISKVMQITNVSEGVIDLPGLVTLEPGEHLTVFRTPYQLASNTALMQFVGSGDLVITEAPGGVQDGGGGGGGSGGAYDVSIAIEGTALGSETVLRMVFPRSVSFETNFALSSGVAGTAGGTDTVFSIKKNGVEVGQVTFATNGQQATFAGSAVTFNAGDVMTVVAPNVATTLADIAVTLAGTRA